MSRLLFPFPLVKVICCSERRSAGSSPGSPGAEAGTELPLPATSRGRRSAGSSAEAGRQLPSRKVVEALELSTVGRASTAGPRQ